MMHTKDNTPTHAMHTIQPRLPGRWPLGALLIIHGLIHALGVVWVWDLADVDELGGPTFFSQLAIGDLGMTVLGVLWLAAMVGFVVGGIGVAAQTQWALPLVGGAAIVSLVPTMVWWGDAWAGALVSAAVVVFVFGRPRLLRSHQP